MVVEDPNGTLFVAGYGEAHPTLWKSIDGGITWARVAVGTASDGAIGDSDVDLAVARDGTLYLVAMVFDRKVSEGRSVSVGVSQDGGARWRWTLLSQHRFDDRPWVKVSVDGTAHVIWNDGSGVSYAVSKDRGITWTHRPKIHAHGGSSHLAVGPDDRVAVRVTPLSASGSKMDAGVDLIAVSSDGGATWRERTAPGEREWKPPSALKDNDIPRWVEPVAWDARGTLYALWTNINGIWLGRSADDARTWRTWRIATTSTAFFPYLVARGSGELAATWFSQSDAASSGAAPTLSGYFTRVNLNQGRSEPLVVGTLTLRLDSWRSGSASAEPPTPDTAGEYIAIAFLKDGGLAAVTPIQDERKQRFGFSFWRITERAHK
jgi:hypothetical protein